MNLDYIQKDMVKWRRDLHKIPELGNNLPKTTDYVSKVLDELGIEYIKLMEGNAIVGIIRGKGEGKTIALRADMDGLPIVEKTGLDFASTNSNMHACGHDGHTAMLLGAAKYLKSNTDKFNGNVKLLFQPGEEFPGGADPMIKEGCMRNPDVDAVFGMHEGQLTTEVPMGNIGFKYGSMMAAMDRILIKIIGVSSHGAYPEQSVDPILLASEIILSLQSIVSRQTKAIEPVVISVCRINGGFNQNIIPAEVELEGTVRTLNPKTREFVANRIKETCEHLAAAKGAKVEVIHEFKYPALINNDKFTTLAMNSAKKIFGENVIQIENPVMGGEDFAYYLQEVPGTFAFMSNMAKIDGEYHPHHHDKFDIDESFFSKGAGVLTQVAMDFLND